MLAFITTHLHNELLADYARTTTSSAIHYYLVADSSACRNTEPRLRTFQRHKRASRPAQE